MERFWKGVSKLTALDLIFDCVITSDMEAVANEIYDFYSIMPDGNFLLMRNKGFIEDLLYFMECITGGEDTDWESNGDSVYADYTKLEFLRGITVEGDAPTEEPNQRNQLIAIRGTCDHKCPQCIEKYNGYALREIPSCDKNLVGTTVWTSKWATLSDFMLDVFMWLRQCRGLDVLIINFDFTPDEYNRELDFGYAACSILVQGNTVKFLSDKDGIPKLYKKYATTYECTDYEIEKAINYCCDTFVFEFEKPKGYRK